MQAKAHRGFPMITTFRVWGIIQPMTCLPPRTWPLLLLVSTAALAADAPRPWATPFTSDTKAFAQQAAQFAVNGSLPIDLVRLTVRAAKTVPLAIVPRGFSTKLPAVTIENGEKVFRFERSKVSAKAAEDMLPVDEPDGEVILFSTGTSWKELARTSAIRASTSVMRRSSPPRPTKP